MPVFFNTRDQQQHEVAALVNLLLFVYDAGHRLQVIYTVLLKGPMYAFNICSCIMCLPIVFTCHLAVLRIISFLPTAWLVCFAGHCPQGV